MANPFFTPVSNALKDLGANEIIAIGPPLIALLTWANANPGSLVNPLAFGPQLLLFQAAVLAAQTTVITETVTSVSADAISLVNSMVAAAKAKVAATPAA